MNKNQLKKVINDPIMGLYFLKSRINKEGLFRSYSNKTGLTGIKGLWFVLSFDCDTEEDFDVVNEINSKLLDIGIRAVYAVPGELLEKGLLAYRDVAKSGVSFINHGYTTHTIRDNKGTYKNALEYDKLTVLEIKEDISRGHDILLYKFGIRPCGFRTPHFGKMQSRSELNELYNILKRIGYTYSTSTIPYYGYRYGAIYNRKGIIEIPISGMFDEPLRIQDSFLYWDNENGRFNGKGYFDAGMRTLNYLLTLQNEEPLNGIINIYADPSQIAGDDYFFNLMSRISTFCKNTTYDELIEMLKA